MEIEVNVYVTIEDIIEDVIEELDNYLSEGAITVEKVENDFYDDELYDMINTFLFDNVISTCEYDILNIDSIVSKIKNNKEYQRKLSQMLDNYKNV